jgi:hypothetical protein
MSVTGEGRDKDTRLVQLWNALSPIVASSLERLRDTLMRFMRPENADAAMEVALSGRVTYWTVVPMIFLNVVGIVVIVLVLLKMMVLKDGQLTGAVVRYDTLDTSRNSVVNLGRVLNTPLPLSVVMEGDNVMEDSLELVNVPFKIVVSVLLRDKSKEPERFVQILNALVPSELNDIGAKVSNPEPLQSWKALSPILVILEEKDATRLRDLANALGPIDVRFWVL